jgi:ABC-2 type transport system ATP-binding protein
LSKKYGGRYAVRDLDLHVRKGELFGFLGPNGAGKTTTMRMLAGSMRPTSGSIRVAGVDMLRDPLTAKSHLGYIPDRPYLYDKLTGREFLRFVGRFYRVPPDVLERRAEAYIELFDLEEAAGRLIETYSHGMKQKLVLASALLHDPECLIVDEPMVGLDPKGARQLKALFRDLVDRGCTVFMSTHSLDVAEHVCDRAGIIFDGRLLAVDTVDRLRGDQSLEDAFLRLTDPEAAELARSL